MAVRDIIARIVTRFDRTSADKTEAEAKKTLGNIEAGAKRIGAAMIAAFSVGAIIAFGKASVAAAIESEAIWNRVSGAVERSGTAWSSVEKKVRAAANALRDVAGIDDDEFAQGFDALLATTGDVNLSLSQMGFAADVAARFFGGDLARAAEELGRIFQGNTRAFRSFGIVTDDVNEGLRILRERSAGAAANEMNSLQGRMEQMQVAAGDLKKEFGFLALRLAGGSDSIEVNANRARLGLDALADHIKRWRGFRFAGGLLMPTFDAPLKEPIDPTAGIATLDPLLAIAAKPKAGGQEKDPRFPMNTREEARRQLTQAAEDRKRALADAREDLQRRIELAEQQGKVAEAVAGSLVGFMGSDHGDTEAEMAEARRLYEDHWTNIHDIATNAAYGVTGAWRDTFTLLISGAGTIGSVFETLGRGIAGSLLGGLAQYASGKVAENTALAVEEVAKGLAAASNPLLAWSAPGHFAAAKGFGTAVAMWSVLAGAAGAGQGAVTRGRGVSGGVPSGAADIGGRLADQTKSPEIHIHVDPFDPHNPIHQDRAGRGVKLYLERMGD